MLKQNTELIIKVFSYSTFNFFSCEVTSFSPVRRERGKEVRKTGEQSPRCPVVVSYASPTSSHIVGLLSLP